PPEITMATAQETQAAIPADFSDFERSLIKKSETAIAEGSQLERWARDPNRKIELHELDLARKYNLVNKAYGYFADVTIGGQTLTALGSLQKVEFGKIDVPDPEQRLKDYVLKLFLNTSSWVYPDGDAGGFTMKQMIYCDANGQYGRYHDDELTQVQDWNDIGRKYRWSLFTCYLHDFVMQIGPVKQVLKEAVAVVQHPDFIHVVERPKPGCKLEVAIGYPF